MTRIIPKNKKYSCYFFTEGDKDKKFIRNLIDLDKFKYHTSKWSLDYGSAWGCSPRDILEQCRKTISGKGYSLVLCFIDLDYLKQNFKDWEREKSNLERDSAIFGIIIIWQIDKAEDEYRRVLGAEALQLGKHRLNKLAKERVEKFINSEYWDRILGPIRSMEEKLEKDG